MELTVATILAVTGLTYRALDHLHSSGMAPASVAGDGPGSRRRYNQQAVLAVIVAAEMRSFGLPPPVIRSVSTHLRSLKTLPSAAEGAGESVVIVDGASVRIDTNTTCVASTSTVGVVIRLGGPLLKIMRACACKL